MKKNSASVIRDYLGGCKKVAKAIGIDKSRIFRWTYPLSKRGTGGLIPARHQVTLLNYARANNIDLQPVDFFSPDRLQAIMAADPEKYPPIKRGRKPKSAGAGGKKQRNPAASPAGRGEKGSCVSSRAKQRRRGGGRQDNQPPVAGSEELAGAAKDDLQIREDYIKKVHGDDSHAGPTILPFDSAVYRLIIRRCPQARGGSLAGIAARKPYIIRGSSGFVRCYKQAQAAARPASARGSAAGLSPCKMSGRRQQGRLVPPTGWQKPPLPPAAQPCRTPLCRLPPVAAGR